MSENDSYRSVDKAERTSLSRLMGMKEAGERLWEPGELEDILRHQLNSPLPFHRAPFEQAPGPTPRTLNDLLHHPNPPLELLEMTKEYAKDCRHQPDALLPPEVANVLYYASIVVALKECQKRITNLDDQSLNKGLQSVLAKPWVDEATRSLLSDGVRLLDTPEPGSAGSGMSDE